MGKRLPIVYLHLEPVMIFAVPIILHFLIEVCDLINLEALHQEQKYKQETALGKVDLDHEKTGTHILYQIDILIA